MAKDLNVTAEVIGMGAVSDAAVTDPTQSGSVIALLKGLETELLLIKADVAAIKADSAAIKASTGAAADEAYTTGNGTVISLLKGVFGNTAT